jgi:hypothetical protein
MVEGERLIPLSFKEKKGTVKNEKTVTHVTPDQYTRALDLKVLLFFAFYRFYGNMTRVPESTASFNSIRMPSSRNGIMQAPFSDS